MEDRAGGLAPFFLAPDHRFQLRALHVALHRAALGLFHPLAERQAAFRNICEHRATLAQRLFGADRGVGGRLALDLGIQQFLGDVSPPSC